MTSALFLPPCLLGLLQFGAPRAVPAAASPVARMNQNVGGLFEEAAEARDIFLRATQDLFRGHAPTEPLLDKSKRHHRGGDQAVPAHWQPAPAAGGLRTLRSEVPGLMEMARLNTLPQGTGLVALGAFGARRTMRAPQLVAGRLCLSAMLTAITTSGSMLINDYHDHKLGVDNAQTKPGRPLVTGEVRPATVKLVLKWAYATHLALLCLVDSVLARLWVLASTLLTYLYSVHLKPVTGIKNLTCATIVAMAVGLGAIAVGGGATSLRAVWRPMACVFGLICHREMLMDIGDAAGDRMAGVRTVAVAVGARRALLASLLPLAAAVAAATTAPGKGAAVAACGALLLQGALALSALARGFTRTSLSRAVELAPSCLLVCLCALTL